MLALVAPVTLFCGCTYNARVYDLADGTQLQAQFKYTGSGAGPIWFIRPDGIRCTGEYRTIAGAEAWGAIFGTAPASGAFAPQRGSAVLTCPSGQSFDCEYITSAVSVSGYGYCRDNAGHRWKLVF